jgi:hypothetical protein
LGGDLHTIVETDALTEIELPGEAVRGSLPLLYEAWDGTSVSSNGNQWLVAEEIRYSHDAGIEGTCRGRGAY